MLTRLGIKNFKSIGDAQDGVLLKLRPLNVLVGENGAGKSSILEALGLIGQSVGTQLSAKGELVDFGNKLDPVTHKTQTGRWLTIQVGTQLSNVQLPSNQFEPGEYVYQHSIKPSDNNYEHRLSVVDNQARSEKVLVETYSGQVGNGQQHTVVNYRAWGDSQYNTSRRMNVLTGEVFEPESAPLTDSSLPQDEARQI